MTGLDHEKANRRVAPVPPPLRHLATDKQRAYLLGLLEKSGIRRDPRRVLYKDEAHYLINELKDRGPGPVAIRLGCVQLDGSRIPRERPEVLVQVESKFGGFSNFELMGIAFALRHVVAPVGRLREELNSELARRA